MRAGRTNWGTNEDFLTFHSCQVREVPLTGCIRERDVLLAGCILTSVRVLLARVQQDDHVHHKRP